MHIIVKPEDQITPQRKRSVVIAITTLGTAYYCSWAGVPSKEEAIKEWKQNRPSFIPYHGQYGW